MDRNLDTKSFGSRTVFSTLSTALTVPLVLTSSGLFSAASANEMAGRGAAFHQFKLDNPSLSGKDLNQSFKSFWTDSHQPSQNQVPADTVQQHNTGRLHLENFSSKAEFKAYQQSLKFENHNVNQSIQQIDSNRIVNANQGFSLDLGSAIESITLGSSLFKQQSSVTINVGGQEKTLSAGSKVTAAEYVAAKQALVAGGQTVSLDNTGRATGGTVDLSAMTTGNSKLKVDDLVVPVSVTASGDFGKQGDVRIFGDLVNAGSINAYSSNGHVNAVIGADSIFNSASGSINSTVSDLTLLANNTLNNFGTITASGNLTLSAGNSLSNSGVVTAQQALNVVAPQVTNAGTLASVHSNVNFDTSVPAVLNINNLGGNISALNGAINIRSADYNSQFDSNVTGGNLLSQTLNVNAGQGIANVNVDELTGVVNSSGLGAHIKASTDVLKIGSQCLTGDPTYFNDSGDIDILGNITVGESLAIVASGNIFAESTVTSIATNVAGNGDITIVAGAHITAGTTPFPGQATSNVTFDGASSTGGSVLLNFANSALSIDTTSNSSGVKAGNVVIAAYASPDGNLGQVILPTGSTISTSNTAGGVAGDVTLLGQNGLVSGTIAAGTGASGGKVTLAAAAPIFSGGTSMTFDTTGAITTGNTLVASNTLGAGGSVSTGNITAVGDVSVKANSTVTLGALTSAKGSVNVNSSFNVNAGIVVGGNVSAAKDVFLTAGSNGAIQVSGTSISGHNILLSGAGVDIHNMHSLDATADSSGNGGSVELDTTGLVSNVGTFALTAKGTGVDGDGGTVRLNFKSSNAVSVGTSDLFTFDASGSGTGDGGKVFASFGGAVTLNSGAINAKAGATSGNGGTASVTAGTALTVNAGAITAGTVEGDGAKITLKAGALTASLLTLNDTSFLSQVNGQGSLVHNGGSIELQGTDVVIPAGNLTLQAIGTAGGNGGAATLTLQSTSDVTISNVAKFNFDVESDSGTGGIATLNAAGNLFVDSGAIHGGGDNGGTAIINAAGNLTYFAGGIDVGPSNGNGGHITLRAGTDGTGTLSLGDASVFTQAQANGTNSDGGSIVLFGATDISYFTTPAAPLVLVASGTGTGSGGLVSYETNSLASTFILPPNSVIAKPPKPPVMYLALGAPSGSSGGNGGIIRVKVGGNLTVDPNGMIAGPQSLSGDWDGATYSLSAGNAGSKGGTLIVNGSLNANGVGNGLGGNIALSSRSSSAFTFGGAKAPKNGILGSLSVSGSEGFISITNTLGGISVLSPSTLNNVSSLQLTAGGRGSITAAAGITLAASSDMELLALGGGAVGGKSLMSVSTPDLEVQGGTVGVAVNSPTGVFVHDSTAVKSFSLLSNTATVIGDITASAGSITVTQATNAVGSTLQVSAAGLLKATNGGITLQNADTVSGVISLGDNSTVETLGKGKQVSIVVGPVPKTGTSKFPGFTPPTGITALNSGKGVIFFGTPGSVNVSAPGDVATVNAKGVNVLFNSVNANTILLGNGVLVLADPPVSSPSAAVALNAANTASNSTSDASASSNSITSMVGFGETSAFTSDLSVLNLNASALVQAASNANLMTASNTAVKAAAALVPLSDDDSYAVGFCGSSGETDAAICSDSPIVLSQTAKSGQFGRANGIRTIEHRDRLAMERGNVVFAPFRDMVVETASGNVHISANSVVLVSNSAAGLSVFDLNDQHKGAVSIESAGRRIALSPGRHVMLTSHVNAEFAQVNPVETIAHRSLVSSTNNGIKVHQSEFSVITALDSVKPLKAIVMSTHPQGKEAATRMMKTAAILLQLGGLNNFQHYYRPRMTAMR